MRGASVAVLVTAAVTTDSGTAVHPRGIGQGRLGCPRESTETFFHLPGTPLPKSPISSVRQDVGVCRGFCCGLLGEAR